MNKNKSFEKNMFEVVSLKNNSNRITCGNTLFCVEIEEKCTGLL
jgi:hypothetical protein